MVRYARLANRCDFLRTPQQSFEKGLAIAHSRDETSRAAWRTLSDSRASVYITRLSREISSELFKEPFIP